MNNNVKLLMVAGAGIITGYTLGVLLASEDGKQLRSKILSEADKMVQNLIEEGLNYSKSSYNNLEKS